MVDLSRGNDIFRNNLKPEDMVLSEMVETSPYRSEIIDGVKNFSKFEDDDQKYHSSGKFVIEDGEYQFQIIFHWPGDWTQLVNPLDTSVYKKKIVIGLSIEFERSERTIEIAKENDLFRSNFSDERIYLSDEIKNSPHKEKIIEAVRNYSNFYGADFIKGQFGDNISSYGEHAIGQFMFANESYFFEFSYFSKDYEYAGEDPYENYDHERILYVKKVLKSN